MKDLASNVNPKRVISPVSTSSDSAVVGQIIDRAGFDSLTYVIAAGSIGDADVTFAVLLEESDASNMDGASAVDDKDLIGTEALAAFKFDSDDQVRKLGYVGSKRYTRLTITPAGNSGTPSAALLSAVAILGHPALAPTANPPA
ncbi:MAG: hypothetical protein J0H09_29860 [Burkholderiales bacterium]|nr:hypothetical protein [Burkholderiales bacterium]